MELVMKNRGSYEVLDKKERRKIIREANRIAFPLIASSVTNILIGIVDQNLREKTTRRG